MKTCIKCQIPKNLSSFHRNASYTDGHSGTCKECIKQISHNYYLNNKEIYLEKSRVAWHQNKTKRLAQKKEYVKNNLITVKSRNTKWKKANKDKTAASRAKYRATLLQATPKWLTKEDFKIIQGFYKEAKLLSEQYGVKYHVDHIEPLQGKYSIGLHVPWNLQVIPHYINESKANKIN